MTNVLTIPDLHLKWKFQIRWNRCNWLDLQISQFFNFHNTVEEQRIPGTSFYLGGPALSWHQWMFYNNQLSSWPNFLHALQLRFRPSQFDDP